MTSRVDRFMRYVEVAENGCWLWQGFVHPRTGYVTATDPERISRSLRAHRLAYALFVGEIPGRFDVHHECRVRHCVNPDHLRALPREVHSAMSFGLRTHCKHGHEYTPENTRMERGRRLCRECHRERAKRSRERLAA